MAAGRRRGYGHGLVAPVQNIDYNFGARPPDGRGRHRAVAHVRRRRARPARKPSCRSIAGARWAGRSVIVNIIDQRSGGGEGGMQTSESRGPDGRRQIDVLITDTVRRGMGTGMFDREMGMNYGVQRRAVSR